MNPDHHREGGRGGDPGDRSVDVEEEAVFISSIHSWLRTCCSLKERERKKERGKLDVFVRGEGRDIQKQLSV